ncbi:hypothetical protein ACRQ1B_09830 [Rhizobium panacihumi]|uniref:hypothetical protein n=1 Tax=Rhizobium panacihumi TaxID=2008450 RepID=UPI003D7A9EC7
MTSLGFGKPLIRRFAERAQTNGTSIEAELLADGSIHEAAYFAAMARFLRLPFIDKIHTADIVDSDLLDVQLLRPNQIRLQHPKKVPQVAIIPEAARLAELAALLERLPALRQGLVITTPSQIRTAVWQAGAARRVKAAITSLFETRTHASARIVLSGVQGFAAGGLVVFVVMALLLAPQITFFALHLILSLLYLCSLAIRIAALAYSKRHSIPTSTSEWPEHMPSEAGLPVYTVMVALY